MQLDPIWHSTSKRTKVCMCTRMCMHTHMCSSTQSGTRPASAHGVLPQSSNCLLAYLPNYQLIAKALVHDLQTLRKLLSFLVSYDCVSYFEYLEAVFDAVIHPDPYPLTAPLTLTLISTPDPDPKPHP